MQKNALITTEVGSALQVIQMVKERKVILQQQTEVKLQADTNCTQADGANSVRFAKYLRESLGRNQIEAVAINM